MGRSSRWLRAITFVAALAGALLPQTVTAASPDAPSGTVAVEHGRWVDVGPMPSAHARASIVRLQSGRLLVISGDAVYDCCCVRHVDLFVPKTGRWLSRAPLPRRRCSPAVHLSGSRVLVAGGWGIDPRTQATPALSTALIYDARTDRWTPTTPMHHRGAGPAIRLSGGRVMMTSQGEGGWVEIYRPVTQTWYRGPSMANGHSTLAHFGSDILALGSQGVTPPAQCVERYFTHEHQWRPVTWPSRWHCPEHPVAARMADGAIMLLDGTRRVRIYRPFAARPWTALPLLPLPRVRHFTWPQAIVTVHRHSMVIVSHAGCRPSHEPGTIGFVWQPRARVWQRRTVLADGADGLAVTQLRDGSVLLAGGVRWHRCVLSGDHTPSRLAYRYYPGR